MANVMRWRYGETNPVTLPVGTADEIEIGDLVYQESSEARPAIMITSVPGVTIAAVQADFHNLFVGTAMQRSPVGETDSIRIATSGVFEFIADSATFDLGERIGMVDNQKVIGVPDDTPHRAIGRVNRQVAEADTKVLVRIHSTVMNDGPQAVA